MGRAYRQTDSTLDIKIFGSWWWKGKLVTDLPAQDRNMRGMSKGTLDSKVEKTMLLCHDQGVMSLRLWASHTIFPFFIFISVIRDSRQRDAQRPLNSQPDHHSRRKAPVTCCRLHLGLENMRDECEMYFKKEWYTGAVEKWQKGWRG